MLCHICKEEMIPVDKSKDKKHMDMIRMLHKVHGLSLNPIVYTHPKDKGCALRKAQNG